MANLCFEQAPFMVLISALSAWTAVLATENNGLRGSTATQIEAELPEAIIVTPPPPYVPEAGVEVFLEEEGYEEDVRSRSRHGEGDLSMDSPAADGRIIDGEVAALDKFPFFIWMKWRGCGATHIEDEWILTAAHCDCRGGDSINIGGALATYDNVYATIAECFPHPKYKWPDYDYAVCRLTEPIYNRPMARLADAEYELKQDQPLTVIGKGRIEEGGAVASRLMEAIVPYWEKEDCKQKYGSFNEDSMICAGGGTKDACQGDSGGPLFYEDNGEYFQVGIVSWGSGCGREGFPGVYAGVIEQRSWIDETICNNSVNSVASMCGAPLDPSPSPEPINCVDEGGVHWYKGHGLKCSDILEQFCIIDFFSRKCPKTCNAC